MKALWPLFLLLFLSYGCDEETTCSTCEKFSDSFVIGFDPCTAVGDPNGGNVGFVINIPLQKDTVIAYNFPAGIYNFPAEYFTNYRFYSFFPDSALEDFPVKVKYRYMTRNELNYPVCRGDILTGFFDAKKQIQILSIRR